MLLWIEYDTKNKTCVSQKYIVYMYERKWLLGDPDMKITNLAQQADVQMESIRNFVLFFTLV